MTNKSYIAMIAAGGALGLAVTKISIGCMSGSMTIKSSGIDSLLDVAMSTMNFVAIRMSCMPADSNHPKGHGIFQYYAALIQALVITGSGILMIGQAIHAAKHSIPISYSMLDLGVMVMSIIVTISIVSMLRANSKDSVALKADALHYQSDILANSASLAAVLVSYIFSCYIIDYGFAIIAGCLILKSSISLYHAAIDEIFQIHAK